ncbi:MAG: porin, partial [Verrucomicrobia bacterium]|nr:porin [Verrucomicrobiota bacterium]
MIKILGKLHFAIGLACLAWIAPCPLHAMDDETAKTIADLKAQMQALVDEVKQLKAQVATPAPTAPALPAPSATYNPEPTQANRPLMELPQGGSTETAPTKIQEGPGNLPMLDVSDKGLIFRSKDNRHSIRLGGLLQVDDREFADEGSGQASKFLIRRARPYVSGFFYDDWNFRFAEEFALSSPNATSYTSTIAEAFLNYKPINEIQFEAGKYKPPVALEQLATDTFLPFNERSVTSNLSPQRDVGFMTHG